ncbi:phosphotransferase family enzyme [Bacillus oleivorans]|uniref:Phosphotransferase family enzyme n=1 Tax=Bacillus oleivorans TaxID=1448271 RepID=A0A285CPC8_9BACI|nr:aminoglycoside phosphotransferase family protein [Bacillus oleivorans]SNX68833.1 phosphotransferase family enzyme [Bacillus oleivorans]
MSLTNKKLKELKFSLEKALYFDLNWKVGEIKFFASGVVNAVFVIKEQNHGRLAVRVPWGTEGNTKDPASDRIISLYKESTIAKHCSKFNIPVPKVHKVYDSHDISFMVSDFISGDQTKISAYDIGQLISKIHSIPVEGLSIIDQKDRLLSDIISNRIKERAYTLSKIIDSEIIIPGSEEMKAILDTSKIGNRLLHLDVRPPNIIGQNGVIKAIIDWDNAFIGNPIMELMRISESKEIDEDDFLRGYKNAGMIENTNVLIQLIYRLDTALMLAILFSLYVKDSDKRDYYIRRVKFLCEEICNKV